MELKRLFDLLYYQNNHKPIPNALAGKKDGEWVEYSTQNLVELVNKVSRGLLKKGIKKGDKIAIAVDNSCPEWNILDFAIQQVGAITVPCYATIAKEDFEYIFKDSEVKLCFASNLELINKIHNLKNKISSLEDIYSINKLAGFKHWTEFVNIGENADNQEAVESIKDSIKNEDLVTIIYTSGTTGKPKGVMLSHKNILSNVIASNERIPDMGNSARALSFLPICHVFERMLIYLYFFNSIGIYYAESIELVAENLKEVKPHIMTVVPRVIEKLYNKIYETGMHAGPVKSKIFRWSLDLIKDYNPLVKDKPISWYLKYKIANKLVFSKWREGIGGNVVTLVSGSAKLSPHLITKFWAAGIPILEGYGLTETSPVVSVNSFNKENFEVGTVGQPLDNVDVKIAEDGEILVKGPNVFMGYYNRPERTEKAFTKDGFFKTGDIGIRNNRGLLKITGRKKQIFKTSGGKYIAPEPIQNKMLEIPFIAQIMVVGEDQKMPAALIQPNYQYIEKWANNKNIEIDMDPKKIAKNHAVINEIKKEIDLQNEHFGHWEQIKKFVLTPEEWTVENDLLTPTLKLKRKNIKAKFIDLYEELYTT